MTRPFHLLRRLAADLGQRLRPREFRIDAPPFADDIAAILESLLKAQMAAVAEPPPAVASPADQRFFADLATGVWRLRKRMLEPGTDKPREQFRREFSHLESIWDVLSQAGVRIQDHTGEPDDPGRAIEIAGRVPAPGLTRERVLETVRPTIYYKGEHIQTGSVLVETPG